MAKFYKISTDGMFKSIFENENNKHLLERIIEEVIKEKVIITKLLVPELRKNKITVKGKTLDVLVKTDNKEINIEINSSMYDDIKRRNAGFIFRRYSDSVGIGGSYDKMPGFIQINFSANLGKNYPMVAEYNLYDEKAKLMFINNFKIYEINLEKYKKFCYDNNILSLISMLDMDYGELINVKGDKDMEKLRDEALTLNNDSELLNYLSDEEEEKLIKNTYISKGIEKGIEQGVEQNKIEMVKKMLKENIDISIISRISGLSKSEIEKIRKN